MSLIETLAEAARLCDRLHAKTGVQVTLVVTPTGLDLKGWVDFRFTRGEQSAWVAWPLIESNPEHLEACITKMVDALHKGPPARPA